MKFLSAVLFVLITSLSSISGQSLNIGLDINAYGFIRDHKTFNPVTGVEKNKSTDFAFVPLPIGYHLNLGVTFSKKVSANLKAGLLAFPDMFGSQFGAELRYRFPNGTQLIAPYLVHFNDNSGGNSSGNIMNTLHLLGLGIGKNLTRVTSVELVYLFTVNSDSRISWSYNQMDTSGVGYLHSLIKLGIRFDWSVLDL